MDHPNKKRTYEHLENDSAPVESTNSFPRFLVIESWNEEQPLTKLSPFIIEKVLISIAGSPKSVKKLRTGGLPVEVEKPQHSNVCRRQLVLSNIRFLTPWVGLQY